MIGILPGEKMLRIHLFSVAEAQGYHLWENMSGQESLLHPFSPSVSVHTLKP